MNCSQIKYNKLILQYLQMLSSSCRAVRFPAKPDKDKSSKITNVPSHSGPVHILESCSHPGI
ncbi:hypothetical protein O3M35_003286 [Rhynocoris fuscipes]|uniref:Uncharacterized protein n=1 Tax=Rhynocoris fuscipes TaxID=488301 RepID=A0AAW1CJX9_9HEMI